MAGSNSTKVAGKRRRRKTVKSCREKEATQSKNMCGIWTIKMVINLIRLLHEVAKRKAEAGGHTCNLQFYNCDWSGIAEKINNSKYRPKTPIEGTQVKSKASDLRLLKCTCLADIQKTHKDIWDLFCEYRQLHAKTPVREKLQASLEVSMYESGGSSIGEVAKLIVGEVQSSMYEETQSYPSVQAPPDTFTPLQHCLDRLNQMFRADEISEDIHEKALVMLWKKDDQKWIAMINAMNSPGSRGKFVNTTVEEFVKEQLARNDQ